MFLFTSYVAFPYILGIMNRHGSWASCNTIISISVVNMYIYREVPFAGTNNLVAVFNVVHNNDVIFGAYPSLSYAFIIVAFEFINAKSRNGIV